ncbi:p450 domain-containing protein [Cephalotus follicularis]|uniref:p450 domain-containing protein n=1 Tax=Cephalotus follicularis TaxID=3775 RepID=A0A1Q3BKQ0_CEPFO|nr:p450 domain-containing protein [Cephalotus follicularis]
MAIVGYIGTLLAILCFLFIFHRSRSRNSRILTTWPIVGMLPGLLCNAWHIHDFITQLMKQSGGSFEFKGPCFPDMDFLVTCDPKNVNHILNRSFANYQKGSEFKEIFEILGDGIFNSDSDAWKFQRKLMQSLMKNTKFELFLAKTVWKKVMKGLVPVLDHFSGHGLEVDMQDLFQRFTFDNICSLVLGFDPSCLSVEFPKVVHAEAFEAVEEALLYRHILPTWFWKLQKWLQIGEEQRLKRAWDTLDSFICQCIYTKQENLSTSKTLLEEEEWDLLTALLAEEEDQNVPRSKSDKFLRDTIFNLIIAGRDTVSAGLSWFLWLVATNPLEETKILEEIESNFPEKEVEKRRCFNSQELNKLVYLHAALCEALRMYPSVPINHKAAVEADTLPTGHRVHPSTRVLISFYAMGRMEEIWGEDCSEFKPGRWITEKGSIIHVPSYKFTAFNSGPRTCLGKDMSLIQMKIVAIILLRNYRFRVVENHSVSPGGSVILHIHGGLKVRITKRCVG